MFCFCFCFCFVLFLVLLYFYSYQWLVWSLVIIFIIPTVCLSGFLFTHWRHLFNIITSPFSDNHVCLIYFQVMNILVGRIEFLSTCISHKLLFHCSLFFWNDYCSVSPHDLGKKPWYFFWPNSSSHNMWSIMYLFYRELTELVRFLGLCVYLYIFLYGICLLFLAFAA